MSRHAAFVLLCLAGCGGAVSADSTPFDSLGGEPATSSATTTTSTTTSSSTSTTSTSSTSTTGDLSSSTSLDTSTSPPQLPDFGDGAPLGCKGKIDIIFAISTDWFMKDYQPRLLAAFPEFRQALEDELGDFDLHILVTDSSYTWSMDDCSICQDPADCDPNGVPDLCGATLDECDSTLGSGTTFASDPGSSGRRCKLAGGHRYITSEEPDLGAAFECLARVGYAGATPLTFDAILQIVGPPLLGEDVDLNGPGGCNEGFLRDDALLLLVIIQNQYEQFSLGGPYQWTKALYAAKGGDEDAVIALAITTDRDISPGLCAPGEPASGTNRTRLFIEDYLKHGTIESICAPSYGDFFRDVVSELAPLCDAFIPK
ncbi:hypothetical protein [Nannocystis sp. SCPEA4]|uniref:hypothetical protein n=1 Tax=Nannocystis sp. SCPEA4 TaxID=2996787 RepID=UPI00226F4A74|nr:hypothetical protein [Nannocystis sp. SCPEA4]MCY1055506.1 hypothetical protein [Nannocystis sp. SCPEA4]